MEQFGGDLVDVPVALRDLVKVGRIEVCDLGVYVFLLFLAPKGTSSCVATPELISVLYRLSARASRAAFRNLEREGLIRIKRKHRRSVVEVCVDLDKPFRSCRFRPSIPKHIRKKVLQVGRCTKCGSTENLVVDHILAYSRGGAHDISNFQCLCDACNRKKYCN